MSISRQEKLQKDNDIAEKYLKFLMEAYILLSKGYTAFKIGVALKRHSVDKHTFTAVVKLGWIAKLPSEKTGTKYYWRGPVPTIEHTDQVRKQLNIVKKGYSANTSLKETPVSKITGKKLIPVIKTQNNLQESSNRRIVVGAEDRYLEMMSDLYLEVGEEYKPMIISTLGARYKIGTTASKVLRALGYLDKQKGSLNNYKWVGPVPTLDLARAVLKASSDFNKKYQGGSKGTEQTVSTEQNQPINTVKTTKIAKIKENILAAPIVNNPGEKELSKDIAMKLFQLGCLKEANEVLDTLLIKK